jgi:OmpR family two-component system sensor histidine kinase YxdK
VNELGRRFLAAHRSALLLAYGVALLLFLLMGLLLSFTALAGRIIITNLGYGLALTTVAVAAWLFGSWLRWAPFARALLAFEQATDLTIGGALPPSGTADQALTREAIQALYALAAAERSAHQAAYQQHRAYIALWVHQMKTPVSVIHLLTQGGGPLDEESTRSLEEEASKLSEGLEQALATARLIDASADFRIERVDLLAQLRGAVSARKKQLIRLSIYPQVEADEGADWTVRTDPKWNRFLLDQLIGNAIKYGSQAGPTGQRLRCRLWREGYQVHLTIEDEGPGIPPGDLGRIFDPFFTGQNGRRYADATGMGLYLVRRVLDQVGHEIQVESQVGIGTTVRLTYGG